MRDSIATRTVLPARRAALFSRLIKVSRPITAQLADWLNWTIVDDSSGPRAPQILSIKDIRPYSLAVVPQLDRVVTTSADMHGMKAGRSVQVWRLSDLALLHTVAAAARTARRRATCIPQKCDCLAMESP